MSRSLWNASSAAAVPPARSGQEPLRLPQLRQSPAIGAYYRLSLVLDSGSFRELDAELAPQDVLGFPGYTDKLSAQTQKTGLSEAAVAAVGRIGGVSVVAAVLDSRFFMGSMSTAVGEKITRAIEYAAAKNCRWSSFRPAAAPDAGGHFQPDADGQDQRRHRALFGQGRAVHQCVDPPHYRRRYRQLCQLGDIMLAEPGALIGFAGPRVIEQTIGERLPEGFQRSEFQLEHGFVDKVVPRSELRATLIQLLQLHAGGRKTE